MMGCTCKGRGARWPVGLADPWAAIQSDASDDAVPRYIASGMNGMPVRLEVAGGAASRQAFDLARRASECGEVGGEA